MSNDQKALIDALKEGEIFSILERLSDDKIRATYGIIMKLGPQSFGHEKTDRILTLIGYELNRRENNRTFNQMWWLTVIAISLAIVQIVVGFIKH